MFHKDWSISRSRVRLLRALNPGVPVHGLYGGEPDQYAEAVDAVGPVLDSLCGCQLGTGRWRWQHTDLVVRDWFQRVGRGLPFDVLHVMQWDLLLFDSLERLYGFVPPDAVALTGITPLDRIADGWHWTRTEPHRTETADLLAGAQREHGFRGVPKACLGPGAAFPRSFLDRYAATAIPEIGHDEVRLPLFAELFGYALVDTGFYPRWYDAESERLFNANGTELPVAEVREELLNPAGRRAFHPCRESFTETVLTGLVSVCTRASRSDGPSV